VYRVSIVMIVLVLYMTSKHGLQVYKRDWSVSTFTIWETVITTETSLLMSHARLTWVRYGENRVLIYFEYIPKARRKIS
jgi:hypothetical protein